MALMVAYTALASTPNTVEIAPGVHMPQINKSWQFANALQKLASGSRHLKRTSSTVCGLAAHSSNLSYPPRALALSFARLFGSVFTFGLNKELIAPKVRFQNRKIGIGHGSRM